MKNFNEPLKFKQNSIDLIINYLNNNFISRIYANSGESEIQNGKMNATNIYDKLDDHAIIGLNFDFHNLNNFKILLRSLFDYLRIHNLDLQAQICFHQEEICINDTIFDERKYGIIQLIFNDEHGSSFIYEIPITSINDSDFELNIRQAADEYIKNALVYKNKKSSIKNFESIPVVISPHVAGYFIHEILGHVLENDLFSHKDCVIKTNSFKASPKLSVYDSIEFCSEIVGLNKYDDNGIQIETLDLVVDGCIKNIITTNPDYSLDHKLYGMARRQSYKEQPLPRMRGTFVRPYDNLDACQIIAKYSDGIYIDRAFLGYTNPFLGEYSIQGSGFVIKNGECSHFVNPLVLCGNILNDLKNIEYIGNDFKYKSGGCQKAGQEIRVCTGSPALSILNASVEGTIYGND